MRGHCLSGEALQSQPVQAILLRLHLTRNRRATGKSRVSITDSNADTPKVDRRSDSASQGCVGILRVTVLNLSALFVQNPAEMIGFISHFDSVCLPTAGCKHQQDKHWNCYAVFHFLNSTNLRSLRSTAASSFRPCSNMNRIPSPNCSIASS